MALAFGSLTASKIYLGATEINLAYFGATQVYSAGGGAFSAEAQSYFDRLDTAGDTTYTTYKQPLANYIDGLVALGGAYWDTMLQACSYVGVGIEGIVVPLRSGMTVPTNNNFLTADLSQTTGLKAASNEYIDTNIAGTSLAQNDASASVYITERDTVNFGYYMGNGSNTTAGACMMVTTSNTNYVNINGTGQTNSGVTDVNFNGMSRDNSADFDYEDSASTTYTKASAAPLAAEIWLYSNSAIAQQALARIATYHFGPALNLVTLEALQDQLLAEIQYASFSSEAASYFYRLDAAGDTTYTPYQQPLANYIDGLVALGGAYWDTMESACSFVGVGIEGIVVPLRSGMTVPTNNNFISTDLDQITGLLGDGTSYIGMNLTEEAASQDDVSMSCWVSALGATALTGLMGASNLRFDTNNPTTTGLRSWNQSGTRDIPTGFTVSNFTGTNRSVGTEYTLLVNGVPKTVTRASSAPVANAMTVFARATFAPTDSRLATYHFGPALNLATLEALQATLISEIAAI